MTQAAYDTTSPNGSARLPQGERVIAVFRLYRRKGAEALLPDVEGKLGLLGDVRETLREARQYIQRANSLLQGGRVLEREYQFVMFIEQLSESPAARARFSYVRDGYFIDVLPNAQGVTQWRLSGRTHWTPVLVNGVAVDGDAALKDLKELINDRFFPPDGTPAGDYELYWFNYLSAISAEDPFGEFEWLIHPTKRLQVQQIAQRPFQRSFTLEFLGLRNNHDLAKAEDGFLEGLLSQSFLRSLLDEVGLGDIADALEEVFGIVDEFKALLDDVANVVTAVTDYILAVQQTITASIAKVRGILTSVQTIIGRIEDGIDLLRDIPNLTEQQLDLLRQNYPGLVSNSDGEQTAYVALSGLRKLRDFLAAVAMQPAFTPLLGTRQQTVALDVQLGTTLDRLARDTGVSAELLVRANDLRHPFIAAHVRAERIRAAAASAADAALVLGAEPVPAALAIVANAERALAWTRTHSGVETATETALRAAVATAKGVADRIRVAGMGAYQPAELVVLQAAATAMATFATQRPSQDKVLYAGDRIRVPQPSGNVLPSVVGRDGNQILANGVALTEEERLFGIDLALDAEAGDLAWDAASCDLALARGLVNMEQVQRRYVRLPLGALRFAPEIGNFAYADIAKWQGPGTNRLLAYAMFRTLSQDPRVKRVRNVRAETRGGVAHLVYDALLINGKDVPALRAPVS